MLSYAHKEKVTQRQVPRIFLCSFRTFQDPCCEISPNITKFSQKYNLGLLKPVTPASLITYEKLRSKWGILTKTVETSVDEAVLMTY